MNLFQSLNAAATFFIIAALVNGVKDSFIKSGDEVSDFIYNNMDVVLFIMFYIVLKLKMTFDDFKHFAEEQQDQTSYRGWGFMMAVLSWILWAIAGNAASDLRRASALLSYSLTISTIWIAIHMIEIWRYSRRILKDDIRKFDKEVKIGVIRSKWIIINMIYMFCLYSYSYGAKSHLFAEFDKFGFKPYMLFIICIFTLCYDMVLSDPFRNVIKR